MSDLKIFSSRLKELRSRNKLTQKEFSQKVGCTAATLSAYENGTKNPSLEIIKSIAEACEVSIDWLCGLTDKKTNELIISDMSHIVSLLFKINNKIDMTLNYDNSLCTSKISFHTQDMLGFIKRWVKMKDLFDKEMIDNDVYDLWKEKEILNFRNKPIFKNFDSEYEFFSKYN